MVRGRSRTSDRPSGASEATRSRIIEATLETIRTEGMLGASASSDRSSGRVQSGVDLLPLRVDQRSGDRRVETHERGSPRALRGSPRRGRLAVAARGSRRTAAPGGCGQRRHARAVPSHGGRGRRSAVRQGDRRDLPSVDRRGPSVTAASAGRLGGCRRAAATRSRIGRRARCSSVSNCSASWTAPPGEMSRCSPRSPAWRAWWKRCCRRCPP